MSKKSKGKSKSAEKPAPPPQRDLLPAVLALAGAALTVFLLVVAMRQAQLPFCGSGSGCDVVQASRWSTLLGVPIALWGLLVYAIIAGAALFVPRRIARWRMLILFSTIGFIVSIYLNVIAIAVIEATCSYCLLSLALITALYLLGFRAGGVRDLNGWRVGSTFAAIIVVAVMHFHYAGFFDPAAGPEDPYLRELAEHLESSGAKFYGAFWCPHCQQQKLVFGASAHRLPYVECSPNGQRGARATVCIGADIRNYPTWIIGGQRLERAMTPSQLARHSGYRAPPNGAGE